MGGGDWSSWFQPPVMTLFGWQLDGRSIAGASVGVAFDLLSSLPCMRGDGMFVHCHLSVAAAIGNALVCMVAKFRDDFADEQYTKNLQYLTISQVMLALLLVFLVPSILLVGMERAFDLVHVLGGIVYLLA